MTYVVHRLHPIDDDPEDAILWDDCPRCDEHAKHPELSLDKDNIQRLWQRMLDVEESFGEAQYRTSNERRAGDRFYHFAMFLRRFNYDPTLLLKGNMLHKHAEE